MQCNAMQYNKKSTRIMLSQKRTDRIIKSVSELWDEGSVSVDIEADVMDER